MNRPDAIDKTPAPAHPGAADFDFLLGRWRVTHHRLRERLVGDDRWDTFGGRSTLRPLLGGLGNVDDCEIDLPSGPYRAVTLRSFDPTTGLWAIWWLDGRHPHRLDTPMRGRFEADGVGRFHADEQIDGRPVRVRFLWSHVTPHACRWEQAFSTDGGAHWEVNWVMAFDREAG